MLVFLSLSKILLGIGQDGSAPQPQPFLYSTSVRRALFCGLTSETSQPEREV